MMISFQTPEHEATLDAAHFPIPAKGNLVEWEMNMRGHELRPNPLPNGRYRVEEVVWHYGINPRVMVFLTPAR